MSRLTGSGGSLFSLMIIPYMSILCIMYIFAKLSSSWLVQPSSAELRFALYLIIRTHPHQPHPRIVVILIEINIVSLLAIGCRLIFFNVVGVKIILLEVGDCWEEMGKIVEFLFSFQYNFFNSAGGEDTIF